MDEIFNEQGDIRENLTISISSALNRILRNKNISDETKISHIRKIVEHYDDIVKTYSKNFDLPKDLVKILAEKNFINTATCDYETSMILLHALQFIMNTSTVLHAMSKTLNGSRYIYELKFLNSKPAWIKFIYSRVHNWNRETQGTLYTMRIISEVTEFYGYKNVREIKQHINNARAWLTQLNTRKEKMKYQKFKKIVDDANAELKKSANSGERDE